LFTAAAPNAAGDKKRREAVEARNHGDALVHSTEKQLAEFGDKVDAADKAAVESAIADLKAVLSSDDADQIKAKTEALAQAAMKIGEAMYKASQETGAAPEGGEQASAKPDDGVVDADFEEVDDDKKKKSA
jgi:molecular chaperone DnaK